MEEKWSLIMRWFREEKEEHEETELEGIEKLKNRTKETKKYFPISIF